MHNFINYLIQLTEKLNKYMKIKSMVSLSYLERKTKLKLIKMFLNNAGKNKQLQPIKFLLKRLPSSGINN